MRKVTLAVVSAFALMCLGSVAQGADMPVKAKGGRTFMSPAFDWTGFYAGVNAGYGWGSSDAAAGVDTEGGLVGIQAGYNFQIAGFIAGIEIDYQFADISGASIAPGPAVTTSRTSELNEFGTIRGRLGYAVDRWLVYGTAGYAFNAKSDATTVLSGPGVVGGFSVVNVSSKDDGWVAGLGGEYAFNRTWSAKLEYLHLDLDNSEVDLVRAGVNYRFSVY